MSRYSIYEGKFPCHTCKVEVKSVRFYSETKILTWVCSEKHMTTVSLEHKKRKKAEFANE